MKRRFGSVAIGSSLVLLLALGGAGTVLAAVTDQGACDIGPIGSSYFEGGSAEGSITLNEDGALQKFKCRGTVPDLGLLTGAHGAHLFGQLDLTAGGTTVNALVDCLINTAPPNRLSFTCTPIQ